MITDRHCTGIRWRLRKLTVLILALSLVAAAVPFSSADAASTFSGRAPFVNTGRDIYYHNARFKGDLIATGVDVSVYQSTRGNWNTAKKYSVDYAIMRVTWTGYTNAKHSYKNLDSCFEQNYKKAKAAGVMVGAYAFSQARTVAEARNEANWAVKRLKQLGIGPEDLELPVYMDYEYAGPSSGSSRGRLYGVSAASAVKCANAFCKVIRDAGYEAGIYANTSFFASKIDSSKLEGDIDLWCAQYYKQCESSKDYTKWQFSSTAHIYGILSASTQNVGSTDVNFWYLKRAHKASGSKDLAGAAVYGSTYVNYTGKAVLPDLQIYRGGSLLKEGRDYIVGGINNVFKGNQQAYAYVKGIGDYEGYALVPFTIGSGYMTRLGLSKCKNADNKVFFKMADDAEDKFTIGSNSRGGYVRKVTKGLTVKNFLSQLEFREGTTGYTLAVLNNKGKKQTSSVKVATGMLLGVYKTTKTGSKLVGTADITIKGDNLCKIAGNDPSPKQKVVKTVITKLTAAKKAFTIKAEQHLSFVDGYQVQYSLKEDMSDAVTALIGSDSYSNSKKITDLKSGKTYYVRVRTYYKLSGVKYYSSWSSIETVKTK